MYVYLFLTNLLFFVFMQQNNALFHANMQIFFNYPFSASFTHSFIIKYSLVASSIFRAINSHADISTTSHTYTHICMWMHTPKHLQRTSCNCQPQHWQINQTIIMFMIIAIVIVIVIVSVIFVTTTAAGVVIIRTAHQPKIAP